MAQTIRTGQSQTGQAVFQYSGDQVDPANPDTELAPSSASLKLPPRRWPCPS